MNKQRRNVLKAIIVTLEDARELLTNVWDEEQEAFDNMPEGPQESERGDAMQEGIDALEYADSSLEEVIDYINEAIG